jgi:hypothetical protein
MKTRRNCLPHLKLPVPKNLLPSFITFTYIEIADQKMQMKPLFGGMHQHPSSGHVSFTMGILIKHKNLFFY